MLMGPWPLSGLDDADQLNFILLAMLGFGLLYSLFSSIGFYVKVLIRIIFQSSYRQVSFDKDFVSVHVVYSVALLMSQLLSY